ncbi:hypothetical protein FGO68_gene2652 [Halteria grandinella]|uniref:SKP1 component dimerisation domain-containing protein n=1 Tax=Halteria grandinella TaxID=5974 RepID=A0A8J8NIY2_HALGN|nr:hypothetical protein FGO68_gene2652 [Halteria grandinella]
MEDQLITEVPIATMLRSPIIRDMADSYCDFSVPIPLVSIAKKATLDKIIFYLRYLEAGNPDPIIRPPPISQESLRLSLPPTLSETFFCLSYIELQEIIMAASFFDISSLLNLCVAITASNIQGKNLADVKNYIGFEDFTPEEEEQILAENKWANDQ